MTHVTIHRTSWDYFIDTLSCLAVLAGVVSVVLAAIFTNNAGVTQTYLIGSHELNPLVSGVLTTNSETDKVTYTLQYASSIVPILSVAIVGPIDIDTSTGPIFFGLCGCPPSVVCGASTPVCDLSLPQHLSGSISQIQPGGISLLDPIRELRANRMQYELRVFTAANSTGYGAFRSKLPSGGAL